MKKLMILALLLVGFIALYPLQSAAQSFKTFDTQKDVPVDKTFTIKFNQKVDIYSIDDNNIFVKDARGNVVPGVFVALSEPERKEIIVKAPAAGYNANSRYTLHIENGIESAKGKRLLQAGQMIFTTSNRTAQKFEPRENSLNEVAFQPGTVTLTEQQGNALIDGEEQDQQFSFHAKNGASIEQLKRGDIVIFPATDDSPNGFAKKVVSVTNDGKRITLKTSEPTFDEVIKEIDISKVAAISTDDFKLSKDVEALATASLISKKDRKKTFKNKDGSTASIDFVDITDATGRNVGTKIVFDNFKYDLFKNGKNTPLDGNIEFIRPMMTLDTQLGYAHHLAFASTFNLNFEKTLTIASFKKDAPERVPLPVELPVKYGNVVGGTIIPYLEMSAKGDIQFGFSVGYEANVNIGLRRGDDGWEGFNDSSLNPVSSINSLSGKVEARLAAGIAIQAEVLQFALGGVEGALFGELNLQGELSSQKVCYDVTAFGGFQAAGYVGDHERAIIRITMLDLTKKLGNNTKCEMKAIESKSLTIDQGKSKKLAVSGTNLMGQDVDFELPNSAISFRSHNEDLATVTKNGTVQVAKDAPKGSTTKVTITYHNISGKHLKFDVTIKVKPEEVVKTYTIKEWGLTFDLPEDVKLYDIEWNYGYHISKGDGFMAYIERYEADFEPSFRGYWSYLGTKKGYSYYVISGFNIFFDDENSPYYDEQAKVFSSIQKSARFQ